MVRPSTPEVGPDMCGIAGWFGNPALTRAEQNGIQAALAHRGPDDEGRFLDEKAGVGLLHRRLSIIDLSPLGHQPMANEDGSIVLCFNGEIYNFASLRQELEGKGHVFRSRTDSEVLVHGWEEWGEETLRRVRGMFAFAIWDAKQGRLTLARDPMGIKPLYLWRSLSGRFVFASEMKAFLGLEGFTARPDRRALRQFLEFSFIPDPTRASLEGVEKLPAGHVLSVGMEDVAAGRLPRARAFYRPPRVVASHTGEESLDARADRLFETLSEVVRQHLVADVPVGLLLSGGLDSSVIAALARRTGPVRTISMGFSDSELDERPFGRAVSRFLGTDHEEVVIRPEEISAGLKESAWFVDDLFGDWGVITTMVLYRKCREAGIRVVLVGEGSDEIFGGYPSFVSAGGPEADRLGPFRRGLRLYRWYSGRRWGAELLPLVRLLRELDGESGGDPFSAVRLFETRHQLPSNYNMKVDRASMAASVEARVPFLDPRVAEEGFRTPRQMLLHDGTNKFLLRHMAERHGLLPRETTHRAKVGGSIAATWMEKSPAFRRFASEVILDPGGMTETLGLRRAMEDYFLRGRLGYRPPSGLSILPIVAWRLLMLNLWATRYLRRPGPAVSPGG
jgi:asparagine synthase (glutamine-hydrolysing)